jgi:hypothetical protein
MEKTKNSANTTCFTEHTKEWKNDIKAPWG